MNPRSLSIQRSFITWDDHRTRDFLKRTQYQLSDLHQRSWYGAPFVAAVVVDFGLCLQELPSMEKCIEVLKEKVPPFMTIRNCDKFVHDGAPCHRTKPVQEWMHQQNIQIVGPWLGNSPDLNPIENCWRLVKEKVAQRNPSSSSSLIEAIRNVWVTEVTPELLKCLVMSMPARIQACLAVHGRHTKY